VFPQEVTTGVYPGRIVIVPGCMKGFSLFYVSSGLDSPEAGGSAIILTVRDSSSETFPGSVCFPEVKPGECYDAGRYREWPAGRKVLYFSCAHTGMQEPECHENYPAGTVIASNLVQFLIWGIGAYLLYRSGLIWVIGYVLFILLLEFRLLSSHCVDCYYYGRTCAFGKGYLSSVFFLKGRPEQFSHMTITWKDIVPDFLVFIVPVLAGTLLLLREFSWTVLICIIALFLLGFLGNALVRGQLACRYCKQREIGCPAAQLFNKTRE